MQNLSSMYMNTHYQLFCIFEDFYNKVLGKKNNAGIQKFAFIITTSQK